MGFFTYQGWIEIDLLGRLMRKLHRGESARIDDTFSGKPDAAQLRAVLAEQKRLEERNIRRSFGMAARNVEVFHRQQSIASRTGSTSRMPSSGNHSVKSPLQ
jgi:hypothetical protein